ncbi:MAG TPA: DUF397 domain-containing protein [Pseudonocardiaceae bacterium]|jgi:hypothetical protein|nr:DUF397 domain-containing protein [Pseudonocardiaceae bacterium]
MIDENVPAPPAGRDGWFTSSYSNATGSCVEVKFARDAIMVRDSKDKRVDRPIMAIGGAGWRAFLDAVTGPES